MDIITKRQATELGLKKYFTGEPCKNGHVSERYTKKSTCIECLKISSKNRIEEKREYDKKYYHSLSIEKKQKERERLRAISRKKYWSDPEKYRKKARERRIDNIEYERKRLADWKERNPNWASEYRQRQYVKETSRIIAANRRSKLRNAIPRWADLDKISEIYKSCPDGYHVDHIIPLVSKIVCGLHCESNLRHLPALDNLRKNNKIWPDMP